MRKIIDCKAGSRAIVETMDLDAKSAKRLHDMGVYPGALLTIHNNEAGEMVVGSGELRVILTRQIAEKVFVA